MAGVYIRGGEFPVDCWYARAAGSGEKLDTSLAFDVLDVVDVFLIGILREKFGTSEDVLHQASPFDDDEVGR